MAGLLPPGQIETRRFPIVGEREPDPAIAEWSLTISGLVEGPRVLDLDSLRRFGDRTITFDIHCVTGWTRFESTFIGIPLHELLSPAPDARFISFASYSGHGHHTSLTVDYALEHSWVVHGLDGRPLDTGHGGPVRVVTPGKYFYKSIKWLKSIDVLDEDRLGWWETNSSYHNNADPMTGEERFTTGSLRPGQLERFLEAAGYDKYRGRVLIGLDLRPWSPSSSDLQRLYLKACNLSGIDLSGANLRNSNLSLSNLSETRLVGADLSGSDLEGADFSGADLRNADLSDTALSATRFDDADVEGARFDRVMGLVEDQEAYLASCGVSLTGR